MEWLKNITRSSANPDKIAMTAKGVLLALVPVIVAIVGSSGIDITQNEIIELINSLFVVVSAVMVSFGLGRKVYLKIIKK